jgi:hypothetical protein
MFYRIFKSELTLKSIFNIKKTLNEILKTNKVTDRNTLWSVIEMEYINVINLARIIFFYIIQMLFDRSNFSFH